MQTTQDLGALQVTDRPNPIARWLGIAGLLPVTLGLLVGLVLVLVTIAQHVSDLTYVGVMALVALAALALGAFGVRRLATWIPNPTVSLFERGIVVESGGQRRTIAWSALTEVRFRAVRVTRQTLTGTPSWMTYRVELGDGATTISLTESVSVTPMVLERARRYVVENVLPAAIARVRAGETLTFGPARVGRDGIGLRGKTFEWSAVRSFGMKEGVYRVRGAGGSKACVVADIPNVDVFDTLCAECATLAFGRP